MKIPVVIGVATTLIIALGTAVAEQEIGKIGASVDAGIALLGAQHEDSQEPGLTNCLAKAMRREQPELTVIPSQQFRDSLFPFFEASTAPKTVDDLALLLERPQVLSRVHDLGVRHLIFISGATSTDEAKGPFTCAGAEAGAGCWGILSWEKVSDISAIIWDLHKTKELEKVEVAATGRTTVVSIIVPIPFISATKRKACRLMAIELLTRIKIWLKYGE